MQNAATPTNGQGEVPVRGSSLLLVAGPPTAIWLVVPGTDEPVPPSGTPGLPVAPTTTNGAADEVQEKVVVMLSPGIVTCATIDSDFSAMDTSAFLSTGVQ